MLEGIAQEAESAARKVTGAANGLRSLPNEVEAAISGTTTHVDQQIVTDLNHCGGDIANAEASLRATAAQARRAAEVAKAQAARAEREQQERAAKNRSSAR